MTFYRPFLTGCALLVLASAALAQPNANGANSDGASGKAAGPTLSLDATASQSVPQDTAWASFSVEKESRDQAQAQQAGRQALGELTAAAKKYPHLQVSTDSLFTNANYSKDGKITSWRTYFSLRIESTDTEQVAQAISELMTRARLSGTGFTLSPAARKKTQDQLIADAVKEFEAKAKVTASAMGFARYEYGQVTLSHSNSPMPRIAMMAAKSEGSYSSDSTNPITLEPGKAEVSVSLSGSVKLLK